MVLGYVWYSHSFGFGKLISVKIWGSYSNYEKNCKPLLKSDQINVVTWSSVAAINLFIMFFTNYIFAPHTYNDVFMVALLMTVFHFIVELPHLGYELRSYGALVIHAGFHFFMFLIPLFVSKYFFLIPSSYIKI